MYFRGPLVLFELAQTYCEPPYYDAILAIRVKIAAEIGESALFTGPRVFQRALSQGDIPDETWAITSKTGGNLLHSLTSGLGEILWERVVHICKNEEVRHWYHRDLERDLPGTAKIPL